MVIYGLIKSSKLYVSFQKSNFFFSEQVGEFFTNCQTSPTNLPVTFKTDRAQYKQSCRENQPSLNASFEFRTFEESGLLFYHKFQRNAVKLMLSEGRLKIQLQVDGISNVDLDNSDQTFNDGKWHSVEINLMTNLLVAFVDNERIETQRALQVSLFSYLQYTNR